MENANARFFLAKRFDGDRLFSFAFLPSRSKSENKKKLQALFLKEPFNFFTVRMLIRTPISVNADERVVTIIPTVFNIFFFDKKVRSVW